MQGPRDYTVHPRPSRLHCAPQAVEMAFTCTARRRNDIVTPASGSCKGHFFDGLVRYWWSAHEIDPLSEPYSGLPSPSLKVCSLLDSALNC